MTELNTKDKVLLAIYKEYQKDVPDMKNNINAKNIGVDLEAYKSAMEKHENEGNIRNVTFTRGGNRILLVFTDNLMITEKGINYVKENLL
ncbi:YjcQ family protein [Priestia megaterium]|uniref:YjcQ family protein n=1 Tax=Priestia megaterium TaxID=1404 RepID=UPI002FFF26F1